MRAPPNFWTNPRQRPGWQARIFAPLSWVWSFVTAQRLARGAWLRITVPVICVGNLNVGGTGKTPAVTVIAQRLKDMGVTAHILTRGYGGSDPGPTSVDLMRHTSTEVGDEALLLAGFAPTWVSRDRAAGAHRAEAAGADVILMDDGFQNPGLFKDLSILVVDAETGFGNGCVVPGGPLREPLATGLARADLVLSIGTEQAQATLDQHWPEIADLPRIRGALVPLQTGMNWVGLRALAFAGIGRPQKFFQTLKACGAEIAATRSFPDHARYSPTLLRRLEADAKALSAQLVTTEKDAVRLPPEYLAKVLTLPVRLTLQDWAPLDAALAKLIRPASR